MEFQVKVNRLTVGELRKAMDGLPDDMQVWVAPAYAEASKPCVAAEGATLIQGDAGYHDIKVLNIECEESPYK